MAQVRIRIEDSVKEKADIVFEELGLNMTLAVNIFLKQVILRWGMPFELTADASQQAGRQASLESLVGFASQNRRIESGYTFDRDASHDR
jgi:DNA-damage-inducible protein J